MSNSLKTNKEPCYVEIDLKEIRPTNDYITLNPRGTYINLTDNDGAMTLKLKKQKQIDINNAWEDFINTYNYVKYYHYR